MTLGQTALPQRDVSADSPRNLSVTPIRLTAVTLRWTPPLTPGVYHYQVKYCQLEDSTQCANKQVFNVTSFNVTVLKPDTQYVFTVSISETPDRVTNQVIGSGIPPSKFHPKS
jgi:hypothetical protein